MIRILRQYLSALAAAASTNRVKNKNYSARYAPGPVAMCYSRISDQTRGLYFRVNLIRTPRKKFDRRQLPSLCGQRLQDQHVSLAQGVVARLIQINASGETPA